MQAVLKLLVTLAVASVAVSKPVSVDASADAHAAQREVISLKVVASSKRAKTGPQALAAVYRKYNIPVPETVQSAAKKADRAQADSLSDLIERANSVPAMPESYDAEYLCPVYVGSNSQLLYLNFDTGSADLWVFSSLQASSQSMGHSVYNPTSSTSSRRISGATFNVQYGDGSGANGIVYTDTVNIAGVSVTSQAVEAAQSVSAQFQQDLNADGIVGLGFNTLNTVKPTRQSTYFDNAVAQGKLQSTVFTADLKKGKVGSYTFGSIESTQYTGAITYTPVDNSRGYWGFNSSGYQIGSSAFTSTVLKGIADTGTTLLLLPGTVVSQYWSRVSGAAFDPNYGAYTFPCSQAASLPTLTLGVGTGRYTLPGPYLNYGPVTQTQCYGGLQSGDNFGMNIYGDIFLKGVFVVFDKTGPRIGFANKNLS